MWKVNTMTILMTEGDFGIDLPIVINGITLTASDTIALTIKDKPNGDIVITKTFTNIANNTITLTLTEAETALLPVGAYTYTIDWYQNNAFMCNIVEQANFKVVDKA